MHKHNFKGILKCSLYKQGSKLTFLLGSTGAPNFKKLGAP